MMRNTRFILGLTLLALTAVAAPAAHAIWPDDHLDRAEDWILDPFVKPENNLWGSPASITIDADGTVHATTQCGSFTSLLLKASYPGVITDTVLKDLTGSISPFAVNWYNAIVNQNTTPAGIFFTRRATAAAIQPGDILAAAYTTSGDSGHVMTVRSITLTAANADLPAGKTITGVTKVNRYQVLIYDSTKSPHGAYASHPVPDTRYKQVDPVTGAVTYVTDTGIGHGAIAIYEDATPGSANAGRIVAWAWNLSPTTDSFYNSITPHGNTFEYRPLVAGFLDGPGL